MSEKNTIPVVTRTQVYLTDPDYFCNKSWTVSFNFNTKSWISFHSYLPNFYIGENNFFYSGLNACCDDFNFEVLAGPIVVGTTTTTTTILPITTTTTTTTIYVNCNLNGNIIVTNCNLVGNAIITVPPTTTTTVCSRPSAVDYFIFIIGYKLGAGPVINSTGSLSDACSAISNTLNNPIASTETITLAAIDLVLGQIVYYDDASTDCTLVPNGWYFTYDSQATGFVYQILSGTIVAIENCSALTTTTTTTGIPCLEFIATTFSLGTETLVYIDCNGDTQTIIVAGAPSETNFCCRSIISYTPAITLAYNGLCLL